jgi:hypothetical protein
MKARLLGILVLIVIVGIVAAIAWQRRESPQGQRDDLVADFVAVVSDSISNGDALQEIHQMFYLFYGRAEEGKIDPADVAAITGKLAGYVKSGRIGRRELDYFMAEVGYTTYKNDPRYNPDSTVDHPLLNPERSMVKTTFDTTQFDSSFWAGFDEWKQEQEGDFSDTARRPDRR